MGILNSTGQVIKNNKKFKEWEQQEADKQAQREALYQKQLDDETLKKAAEKGKVIMDVVDIMDTHSEEVAENVETAVMPIAQIVAPLTLLGSGILGVKYLDKEERHLNKTFEEFLNTDVKGKEYKEIIEKLEEISLNSPQDSDMKKIYYRIYSGRYGVDNIYGKKVTKVLKESSDANIQEKFKRLQELKKDVMKATGNKAFKNKAIAVVSGVAGLFVGVYILANVIGAKLQVNASRVARWQSREDLKDPKYFVQYTPEQIAQAQNNLETNKENEKQKKKGISFKGALTPTGAMILGAGGLFKKKDDDKFEKRNQGFFKTLGSTIKDNKKYKEWAENYNPQDKMIQRQLSEQDIVDAQKDKEIIQRITKKINNNAEEYSEDMEVAAGVIIGSTPWLGLGVSSILNFIVNKTGIAKNSEEKHFKKLIKDLDKESLKAMEEAREALNSTKKEGVLGHIKKLKAVGTIIDNINAPTKNKETEKGFMRLLNKAWDALLSTRYSRNMIVGVVGATLTGIAGSLIGLKLQKASARAGRYKAKQEIQNDPRNFVGYSEKDFEEVKDVKAQKKTFGEKVKETITFIPRVIKDYIEYEKFRKTEAKQDKKLLNELVKLDVTEEQLNEAKDLQRKVFTTFENVDDKSQEYSESIEAMTEMTAPVLPYLGVAVTSLPIVVALIKTFKGGSAHATEAITGFLKKHTNFLKGKTVKKILSEVKDNIPKAVSSTKLTNLNENLTENIDQKIQTGAIEQTKEMLASVLEALRKKLGDFKGKIGKNVDADGIGDGIRTLETFSKNLDEYSTIRKFLDNIIESGLTEKQLQNICANLEIIYNNLSPKEIKEIFDCIIEQFAKEPEKCIQMIKSGNISKIIASKTAVNIVAIAGGTWTALSLLLTYALESILAGMQKNAGKLGVMTALEELGDDRYYANENPNKSETPIASQKLTTANKTQSKMLEKWIKDNKSK